MRTYAQVAQAIFASSHDYHSSRYEHVLHQHGYVRLYLLLCARFWREEAADLI